MGHGEVELGVGIAGEFQGGDGTNTFTGGAGRDVFTGGAATNTLVGGYEMDTITATGATTVGFTAVSDSTSNRYDTVNGFDAADDFFDLMDGSVVGGIDAAITGGSLRGGANFDSTMSKSVNETNLIAHHAVLFTGDSGDLAGVTFLVVDINGQAGYQGGQDIAVRMNNLNGTIATGNFV